MTENDARLWAQVLNRLGLTRGWQAGENPHGAPGWPSGDMAWAVYCYNTNGKILTQLNTQDAVARYILENLEPRSVFTG